MVWDEKRNRLVFKDELKILECKLKQSPHY